jgi:hypothetical protein
MRRTLVPLFILILFSFSFDSFVRATQETALQGKSVPLVPLDPNRSEPRRSFTYNSGIEDPLRVVIRDRDAWRDIWKRIHRPLGELPSLPEIDFSLEMVVVVALGARPTSGYGITVDRAYERDDQLEIVVRRASQKHCGVFSMMTAPVDIVRLPKTKHTVVFRETDFVHVCN